MTIEELKHVYQTMIDGGVELCSVREVLKQLDSIDIVGTLKDNMPELASMYNKECPTCFHYINDTTHDGTCGFCRNRDHYKSKLTFAHNIVKDPQQNL